MSNEIIFPQTVLLYQSVKGVENARVAFGRLEATLASLRGRKFYGYFNPETGEYRACVAKVTGDPDSVGQAWELPAGKYVYEKITDWQMKLATIAPTVEKLIKEHRSRVDWTRPILEYYRSTVELRVMVPISE